MAALALNSKTIPVTLPGDEARKLEVLAEREGRDASDIVAEAVQALWAERVEKLFAETRAYAATRNPHGYTEADVPRLIREVREEAERAIIVDSLAYPPGDVRAALLHSAGRLCRK